LENKKLMFYMAIVFSVVILFMNLPILKEGFEKNEVSSYSPMEAGLLLTLLPIAVLILVFVLLKGYRYKQLYIVLGTLCIALFWELSSDPWSFEVRASLGLPVRSVLIYTLLAIVVLMLAVFAFKKGFED
jgi:hypothetical protein